MPAEDDGVFAQPSRDGRPLNEHVAIDRIIDVGRERSDAQGWAGQVPW